MYTKYTIYIIYTVYSIHTIHYIYYSPSPYSFTGKKTECFQIDLLKGGALFNDRAQTIYLTQDNSQTLNI